VPKDIAYEPDLHRLGELARHLMPTQQVANQQLAAGQELVGHHIPRPRQEASGIEQRLQSRARLGTDLQVVFEDDALAVHVPVTILGIAFQQIDDIVDHLDESESVVLERFVPLTIPMGAAYIVRGNLARSCLAIRLSTHRCSLSAWTVEGSIAACDGPVLGAGRSHTVLPLGL
jgi:hypothetical protein